MSLHLFNTVKIGSFQTERKIITVIILASLTAEIIPIISISHRLSIAWDEKNRALTRSHLCLAGGWYATSRNITGIV